MASLYTVYFDESGTHAASDATVVAGFVSNVTEWEAFSRRWQQVLNDSHLGTLQPGLELLFQWPSPASPVRLLRGPQGKSESPVSVSPQRLHLRSLGLKKPQDH